MLVFGLGHDSRTLWQKFSSKLDLFYRLDCFRICLDSWSILQFNDLSWSGLRRQRWKTWCFHLLSEINHMFFHDLFYRDYDFWISPSWSLQSRLDQRYKKVSEDCLTNVLWSRLEFVKRKCKGKGSIIVKICQRPKWMVPRLKGWVILPNMGTFQTY